MRELRQFICLKCPGKDPQKHKIRLWYDRVDPSNAVSQCYSCKKMLFSVERSYMFISVIFVAHVEMNLLCAVKCKTLLLVTTVMLKFPHTASRLCTGSTE